MVGSIISCSEAKAKAVEKARKWVAENPDRRRAYFEDYCARPEFKQQRKEYQRRYRNKYEDKLRINARERARKAQREEPERLRENQRRWKAANPAKVQANNLNRRASKVPAPGQHTAADIERLYKQQCGRCAECDAEFPHGGKHRYHVDHIIPLSPRNGGEPGSNGPENLQLLCRFCNQSKSNLQPDEWARRHQKLI